MTEQPPAKARSLKDIAEKAATMKPLSTLAVTAKAREAATAITGHKADSVASCQKQGDGWIVIVDVIEAKARVGDNDLIATFEIGLDATGEVTTYKRIRRYYRTERGAADAA